MSHINALQINLSAVGREGQLITSKQAASNQSEITDRLERIIKTMYWSSRGTISGEEGGVRIELSLLQSRARCFANRF